MNETETFEFSCRCNRRPFEVDEEAPSSSLHLTLGVITLGVWLLFFSLYRMIHLYGLSRCPLCGKRSRSLFWILFILAFLTAEFGRTLHFFLISAPQKIVADISFAQLPEDIDPNAPLKAEDLKGALGFVWVVAALPMACMFIATYWPYLTLAWLSGITIAGLLLPSLYKKRTTG